MKCFADLEWLIIGTSDSVEFFMYFPFPFFIFFMNIYCSRIFCKGPLLDAVQKVHLFHDSKDFVDMSLKFSPSKSDYKGSYSNYLLIYWTLVTFQMIP